MRWRKRSRRVWRGCPSYSTSANERCGCIVALTGSPSAVSIGPAAPTEIFQAFLVSSWSLAGICTLGIAVSTWLPATMILEFVVTGTLTAGMIATGAIMIAAVPDEYRGRVFGIMRGLSVALIPMSALVGGWIAEFMDIWIMFAFAGVFILAVSLLAWANPNVRGARI